LAGTAVGQTTDYGVNAQITLDSNAAGHGWFVYSTPDQNDEFLPTSSLSLMSLYRLRSAEYGWALDAEQTQLVSRVNLTASFAAANFSQAAQKETAVKSTLSTLSQNSNDWQTLGNVTSNQW
jgi:hypothetical protein